MNSVRSFPEKLLYAYARCFPVRRGKMRLVNTLWRHVVFPQDPIRIARLKSTGFSMRCDLRQFLQRQFYFFGTYFLEEEVLDCWSGFARSSKVVFDVGANAGIFSLAALAARSDASVHAFEPTPALAGRLRETVALNNLRTLHVHELAVTRHSGTAYLNIWEGEDGSNEGMNFVTVDPRAPTTRSIQTICLDAFCEEKQIDRIDLLKLDIQGNEAEALAGAQGLLREQRVNMIFAELNYGAAANSTCPGTETIRRLDANGFEFAQPARNPTFKAAGDWLKSLTEVVARRTD